MEAGTPKLHLEWMVRSVQVLLLVLVVKLAINKRKEEVLVST